KHDELFRILHTCGIDDKDKRLLRYTYYNQKSKTRTNKDNYTEWVDIKREGKQGCGLNRLLYNIYAKTIITPALSDRPEGITIKGRVINNLRYAHDAVIIASSAENLQTLVLTLKEESAKYGLTINAKETEVMTVKRRDTPRI